MLVAATQRRYWVTFSHMLPQPRRYPLHSSGSPAVNDSGCRRAAGADEGRL